MSDQIRDIFADWSLDIPLTLAMLLTAAIYIRGWVAIRRTRADYFAEWRLALFLSGISVLWLAICSPIDGFADVMLSAHMIQHQLIMALVPPLLLLGAPVVPMLRGLPRIVSKILGPVIASKSIREIESALSSLPVAWLLFNFVFLGWHLPAAYDFALENESWHAFEHVCFLAASLVFWWPIIRPWPHRLPAAGWKLLLYLLTADLVNTALSAFLAFCDRPVYAYYFKRQNPFALKPYEDQVLGAVIMWVFGSIAYLCPALVIAMSMLRRSPEERTSAAYRHLIS
jgi:cytochrome c oxidase assembly factor CtaG